ncbi:GLRX [Symbiodinium pilosum]|uniref:GLRX protein n=1 Tax=Symbiodinium pilosum TaxID=2952 RepID=A0A812MXZ8_SYMPI|nr:GLRX [Symbiodinium pilosum]
MAFLRRLFSSASPVVENADKLIQSHGCVVFSKSTCPFCDMAKSVLLNELKAKCHVMEMDKELKPDDMSTLQDHFLQTTGARSVPRVFISAKCIGGGSDVAALHGKGELKAMLEKAGAIE